MLTATTPVLLRSFDTKGMASRRSLGESESLRHCGRPLVLSRTGARCLGGSKGSTCKTARLVTESTVSIQKYLTSIEDTSAAQLFPTATHLSNYPPKSYHNMHFSTPLFTTLALAATTLATPLPQQSAASFAFTSWSCDSCGENNPCLSFGHEALQGECYPLEPSQASLKVFQSITPG